MIRELKAADHDTVIDIVNESWKHQYSGYVNPLLLNEVGCQARADSMKRDFVSHRLSEYVWEENGRVLGLLSVGPTEERDKADAFEIWRIYLAPEARGRGVGRKLLAFGEDVASLEGYREIIIWVFRENRRAVSFYQKHGYRPDKEEFLGIPYQTWGIRLTKSI